MPSRSTFLANLKGWQLWTEFKAFRFVAAFKQPPWKAFWVAVILGTFTAFVIQSVFILVDFSQYNVETVVQLKSVRGLPFPAVTICNLNPIRKSAMDYVEELSDLQTIYKYLSQRKTHESGNDTSAGTSRKKRSANDGLPRFREFEDQVLAILAPVVKRRPKRYNDHYNTSVRERCYDHNCGRAHHNHIDRNRVHLEIREELHVQKGVVNDDEFGFHYEHDRDGLDHLVPHHFDHNHRHQHSRVAHSLVLYDLHEQLRAQKGVIDVDEFGFHN